MNKLKKKLFGVAGLLAVVAMTCVAIILPSNGAYAVSSTIPVTVNVDQPQPGPFTANIISPQDDAKLTADAGNVDIYYKNANSLTVTMTAPDGTVTVLRNGATPDPENGGNIDVPYTFDHGFGDYTFSVSGTDLEGNPQTGPSTSTVHYHSGYFEILPDPDENGDPIAKVTYGPNVCGVRFTITSVDDPSKAPTYYPGMEELPISCRTMDTDGDGVFETVIPLSELDLPEGTYNITMTTYGCTPGGEVDENDIIEESIGDDGNYDGDFVFNPEGEYVPPEVPETGFVRIGGLMIAQRDLILTGIIAATAVAGIYFAKKNRKQIK